jgi:GST-like protein
MIDLYTWPTPNGRKIHIMLEETELPYTVHAVNTRTGDQFKPEFLKISPNNKIPAIVDQNGPGGKAISLFESGAILIYLAEKAGKYLPSEPHARYTTLQWLMFQMSGVGPMFGQASHFRAYSRDQHQYSIERYTNEVLRLHRVMDRQLGHGRFLAGDEYTIADIATFPWTLNAAKRGVNLPDYPNVSRWHREITARPAVVRGMALLAEERKSLDQKPTDAEREVMFGAVQYQQR